MLTPVQRGDILHDGETPAVGPSQRNHLRRQ